MVLTQLISIGALTFVALGPGPGLMNREQQGADTLKAYQRLFTPPSKQDAPFKFQFPRNPAIDKRDLQPRVICGMVTVPVTPDLDPKMVVQRKADTKTESKIRMIEPQVCNK